VENVICANTELSDLDELLNESYKKALARDEKVKKTQAQWLNKVRDNCQTVECLKQAYSTRLNELTQTISAITQPANTAVKDFSIEGKYERYVKNKPDKNSASVDIKELVDGQVHIQANAVWIGDKDSGMVNTADIEGTFPVNNNRVLFSEIDENGCKVTIEFTQGALDMTHDNGQCGGLNVTFNGHYKKK
jgi:hypothetical protein